MGEVVAGDYRNFAKAGRLDSVTNYELYKGLWSSFNDRNFYEIAWTLKREFAADGMYRNMALYNFADNHDVNRVASSLANKAHLFPLYGLLFTVPGIPSIYYGSEFGVQGERARDSDRALRPCWEGENWKSRALGKDSDGASLARHIAALSKIRKENIALREGGYAQLALSHEQFAFMRQTPTQTIIAAVNSAETGGAVTIKTPPAAACWKDLLSGEEFRAAPQGLALPMAAFQFRILENC
jgi:glycosidase